MSDSQCSVVGCGKGVHAQGYCGSHYQTEFRCRNVGLCVVEGCNKPGTRRGMCPKHYERWRHNGDPLKVRKVILRANGEGSYTTGGYLLHQTGNCKVYDHIRRAESALGKKLPPKARVHHVDYNTRNNENKNLVICPNQKYHILLHSRTNALNACGHPDWKRCRFCQLYDCLQNLFKDGGSYAHRECAGSKAKFTALEACGNPNWRKCPYCREWDDPKNMYTSPTGNSRHRKCHADAERTRHQKENILAAAL